MLFVDGTVTEVFVVRSNHSVTFSMIGGGQVMSGSVDGWTMTFHSYACCKRNTARSPAEFVTGFCQDNRMFVPARCNRSNGGIGHQSTTIGGKGTDGIDNANSPAQYASGLVVDTWW